jgi:hypothetical protein
MADSKVSPEPVYLPSNEPYLGREPLFQFDQAIIRCLEVNRQVAAITHRIQLSDLQKAACQIIPQGINLALTVRELVRQGYLFGALVLMRPLIERAAIISYLRAHPEEVETWKGGWRYRERPSLSEMLQTMSGGKADIEEVKEVCDSLNHLVHGDPIGAQWNLADLGDAGMGYSVGKVVNAPQLSDVICCEAMCYLIVLMGMMTACFPDAAPPRSGRYDQS